MTNLISKFKEIVKLYGDSVAVTDNQGLLTYQQLDLQSENLAFSINPKKVYAVFLEPSNEYIIAILSVLKAGGVYLPLDTNLPEDYLVRLLVDSKADTIITRRKFDNILSKLKIKTLFIEEEAACAKEQPENHSEEGGYVIYTSGSTGDPKAVEVGISALFNSTLARLDYYGPVQSLPLVHSMAFDVATGCVFWALLSGGTLHIYKDKLSHLDALIEFLKVKQCSHLVFPASLLGPFLEQVKTLPSLKVFIVGGERWQTSLIQKHSEVLPSVSLYNEYGPTETCVWSSVGLMYDRQSKKCFEQSIGQPILNTAYHLHNGELLISGKNLASGYLGKESLTKEKFILLSDGTRAYKTGDLVEVNDKGDFVFKGRVDRQIKVQGYRIEAGEIESVIMKYPGVNQAYVTSNQLLVGFLIVHKSVSIEEIKKYLSKSLPYYMVPSVLTVVDEFPLTPNGKIDDKKLLASIKSEKKQADFESEEEKKICKEISSIMDFDISNPLASLKELGANSLIYIRISAMLKAKFHANIPVSQLFDAPHIRWIVKAVQKSKNTSLNFAPVATASHNSKIPLSSQQKQIWFLHQLSPTSRAYHAQFTLRLKGSVDLGLLQKSLCRIIERHEILRTTFKNIDGVGFQFIQKPWEPTIHVIDLRQFSDSDRQTQMRQLMNQAMDIKFDVGELPLVVWHLYRLTENESVLFQIEHHFVHDGWSGAIFIAEMRDFYLAESQKTKAMLPPLEIQYRDFAYWQEKWMASTEASQQLQYWLYKLRGAKDGVTLPHSRSRDGAQTFEGGCIRANVSAETVKKLLELSLGNGTTLFSVFLSAFALLTWKYTNESDFIVGSAFSNRRVAGVQNLLGMFVNALPLRLSINIEDRLEDLVLKTMKTLLEAQDNQEYPLIDLVRKLDIARDQSKNPLFQLMFAFHDSPMPRFQVDDLVGEFQIEHNHSAKNDINVVCMPNPDKGVSVIWEYNKELYDKQTANRFVDNFLHILSVFTQKWSQPIKSVDFLSVDEVQRITKIGKGLEESSPFKLQHEGFDFQVKTQPHAVALVHKNKEYTYSEINILAEKVEYSLRDVEKQSVIGVALHKSPNLIAGLVGILRSGHSYVCIDFTQPAERIEKILQDSKAVAVICDGDSSKNIKNFKIRTLEFSQMEKREFTKTHSIKPADAAYLIYTSGSTGQPKAVIASHGNSVAAMNARTVYFGNTPPKTLVLLPIYFDVAASMIFWTLGLGGSLVFPDSDDVRDPEVVVGLVDKYSVTHINFVASFYTQLLHSFEKPWKTSLTTVAIGGEPCTSELVRQHSKKIPTAGLYNEYGPTEATVWCSAQTVYSPLSGPVESITVGRPLANYNMFVLNKNGEPVPLGVPGELCIGGAGVSEEGYLNDAFLNEKKFIQTSFGRLYRTGDEAVALPTGEFSLKGRLDDQIKIRGFRIELGEITKALQSNPQIREAFCHVDKTLGQSIIAAYVSLKKGQQSLETVDGIRDFLKLKLPHYMIPASIIILDNLPLNQTGKVNRHLLPQPVINSNSKSKSLPETPEQQKLIKVWQDVLGQGSLGIDDDFFENGGDSLLAIRTVAKAKSEGITFTVSQLLKDRTIRKLLLSSPEISSIRETKKVSVGATAPLTSVQKWFFANIKSGVFNEPDYFLQSRLFDLDKETNIEKLKSAVFSVVQRHDVFRSGFEKDSQGWSTKIISDCPNFEIKTYNWDEDSGIFEKIKKTIKVKGPLFNFSFITSGKISHLMVSIHHLIIDAVSWNILTDEIQNAYTSLIGQKTLQKGHTPSPFTLLAPLRTVDTISFSPSKLIPEKDNGKALFETVRTISKTVSSQASEFISNELQKRFDVSPQNFFLGTFWKTLRETLDFKSLSIWMEGHGRDTQSVEMNEMIGWFTDLYPAYFDSESEDVYDLARAVEKNQSYPQMERPEITFNYWGQSKTNNDGVLKNSQISTGSDIGAKNCLPTLFDIAITFKQGKFNLRWAYSENKFTQSLIEKLCSQWLELIESSCSVIPLNVGRGKRKAFFIHPIGGGIEWYTGIANALHPEIQIFAMKQTTTDLNIEALGKKYVQEIRKQQPKGPYSIAGWSFGAMLAFEIASQIEEQGERVHWLHLMDPPVLSKKKKDLSDLYHHVQKLMPKLSKERFDKAISYVKDHEVTKWSTMLWDIIGFEKTSVSEEEIKFVKERFNLLVSNYFAMISYEPQKTVETMSLSFSDKTCAQGLNDSEAWKELSRNEVKIETIPGDHETMLKNAKLAKFLSDKGITH